MTWRGMLWAAAFAGLTGASLSAAPISGSFNIAGTIIVTPSTINWENNNPPFTMGEATIGPSPTGSFAGLAGDKVLITALNNTSEPVGSSGFTDQLFIQFCTNLASTAGCTVDTALPSLYINTIYPGIYSPAGCAATPPAQSQTCTPTAAGGASSPFNFVNNPPPATPQATATFAFSGDTGPGTSPGSNWIGNFTSQFTVPFQTVLAQLAATGSVSNTYSATFTVSPGAATPETSSLSLLALGLGLVLVARSSGVIARIRRHQD